jgi:cyclopropane fatty-acyl-phospholipid synthase-like methyltransferase
VVGTDQSAGMLAQAHAKHPEVPTENVGLQELAFDAEFDAAMCVDAMEHVFPEDWPLVLDNLRRALRPGGHVYLTVELIDEQELERGFAEATASGLPVVRGEHTSRGGGYHYYPSLDQVAAWVRDAGLVALDSGVGDEYFHLLASRR